MTNKKITKLAVVVLLILAGGYVISANLPVLLSGSWNIFSLALTLGIFALIIYGVIRFLKN